MISSERVTEIFMNCLYNKDEIIDGKPIIEPIYVDGIVHKFGFHPDRIKNAEKEIEGFINELPEDFKKGLSFIYLAATKDDSIWTGSQSISEQLMVLGIAAKKMEYCVPKEYWDALPFNLPYILIL